MEGLKNLLLIDVCGQGVDSAKFRKGVNPTSLDLIGGSTCLHTYLCFIFTPLLNTWDIFSIICTRCGGVGHVTKDCKARRPGEVWNKSAGGAELDGNNDDIHSINESINQLMR